MTWGAQWLFYECPKCGKKFKSAVDTIGDEEFGKCPVCHIEGNFVGETGRPNAPAKPHEYEDTALM